MAESSSDALASLTPLTPFTPLAYGKRSPRTAHRGEIDTLTGLRGVAAAHVLFFHLFAYFDRSQQQSIPRLIENGPCAVTLFFVLSGFVLTIVAQRDTGPMSRSAFYIKRLARLAPLYWLSLLIDACNPATLLRFLRGSDGVNESIHYQAWERTLALLLVPLAGQTWLPFTQFWFMWNAPTWSVSNEALFYLLFPSLLPVIVRWGHTTRRTCFILAALVLAQCVTFVAYGGAAVLIRNKLDRTRSLRSLELDVYATPYVRIFHFIVGAVLGARFQMATASSAASLDSGEVAPIPPWWAADVCALACVALLATVPVFTHGGHVPRTHALVSAATFMLQGPLFGMLIYCISFKRRGLAARLLASSPLVKLGEWSYAMYLLHLPILSWCTYLVGTSEVATFCPRDPHGHVRVCQGGLGAVQMALATVLIVVGSAIAHYGIERPLRQWVRRRVLG